MATEVASDKNLQTRIANVVRGLAADAVEAAQSGHPGLPMGCAEIGAKLFGEVLEFDPDHPKWPDRDRFVLSAGHGSMWLYALLHLSGFDLPLEEIKDFRQLHSITPGHPEYGMTPGVETTTGPLGQGFSNAVGMAIAERIMADQYNTEAHTVVDHHTYCLASDGDMMEGIGSEAASLAGHLGLGKLITIYDDNDNSIAGSTDLAFTEDVGKRFEAYDWHVTHIDGHNLDEVGQAIEEARSVSDRPSVIVAKTHLAYGAPTLQDDSAAHGAPLGEEEVRGMKENLGIPVDETFWIPDDVKGFFEKRTQQLSETRREWVRTFEQWAENNPGLHEQWEQAHNLELPPDFEQALESVELPTPSATRKASGALLGEIKEQVPYLVGGSADLEPSNKTYHEEFGEFQKESQSGRNVRFGVREHAMAGICNGIAYHEGLRAFGATFLVFSDYMRPSVRLAALSELPVVYVYTHDSIYLGEDGPTHQPVEHLESLRLMPNMRILRPADEEETRLAWIMAMERTEGPTALALTRQNLPHLEKDHGVEGVRRGGYILRGDPEKDPEYVLVASGSEVSLAAEVADRLRDQDHEVRVVSVPDRTLFQNQDASYIREVLGPENARRVVLEAGVGNGWCNLVGQNAMVFSVETFGASGPGDEVGVDYGFDPDAVLEQITS